MSTPLSSRDDALAWVSAHAASLNDSAADADLVIPRLGEIGYTLGLAHQGHGYASEAVRALLDHAFEVLGSDDGADGAKDGPVLHGVVAVVRWQPSELRDPPLIARGDGGSAFEDAVERAHDAAPSASATRRPVAVSTSLPAAASWTTRPRSVIALTTHHRSVGRSRVYCRP